MLYKLLLCIFLHHPVFIDPFGRLGPTGPKRMFRR